MLKEMAIVLAGGAMFALTAAGILLLELVF